MDLRKRLIHARSGLHRAEVEGSGFRQRNQGGGQRKGQAAQKVSPKKNKGQGKGEDGTNTVDRKVWPEPLLSSSSSARGGGSPTVINSRGEGQTRRSGKHAADKGVREDHASREGGSGHKFEVLGTFCPSQIRCTKLMEVILHIAQQRHSGLKQFWKRSMRPTRELAGL